MAYFPFFIDIENKKGLIVGGGRIAAHKAEKVKPFGVKITIIAPDIMDKLKQDPAFMCEERPFVPEDIEGCAFVIAATDDRGLNHRISALCQEKGILVNVVDDKDYCGFLFPSLVKEGKLTVLEASVENLPFKDDSFDKIITVESFYFWPDPQANLKEVHRVLKKGGTFLLVADVYQNGHLTEQQKKNIKRYELFNPTEEEFREIFQIAGFAETVIHTRDGENWICVEGHK